MGSTQTGYARHSANAVGGLEKAFTIRARARQICRTIEGQSDLGKVPNASQVAATLEDSIRTSGWVPGQLLGTETSLASEFAVGRRSIRQAGRILAARGILDVRRGKTGGFLVSAVDQGAALGTLSATLGEVTNVRGKVREARSALPDELLAGSGPAAALVRAWFAQLSCSPRASTPDPWLSDRTRAQRIAFAIARDLAPGPNKVGGVRVGTLQDLCERFSSGLPVVVQAIRILEDHGLVVCKAGRTGGILYRDGCASLAVRMVSAHLTSHRTSVQESNALVRATMAAAIDLAHTNAVPNATARLDEHLYRMRQCATPTELGLNWYHLQRTLCDLGSNPILHLLARCFASHVVLHRSRSADLRESEARTLMAESETIVANIKCGRAATSREAHFRCQDALERAW